MGLLILWDARVMPKPFLNLIKLLLALFDECFSFNLHLCVFFLYLVNVCSSLLVVSLLSSSFSQNIFVRHKWVASMYSICPTPHPIISLPLLEESFPCAARLVAFERHFSVAVSNPFAADRKIISPAFDNELVLLVCVALANSLGNY